MCIICQDLGQNQEAKVKTEKFTVRFMWNMNLDKVTPNSNGLLYA